MPRVEQKIISERQKKKPSLETAVSEILSELQEKTFEVSPDNLVRIRSVMKDVGMNNYHEIAGPLRQLICYKLLAPHYDITSEVAAVCGSLNAGIRDARLSNMPSATAIAEQLDLIIASRVAVDSPQR